MAKLVAAVACSAAEVISGILPADKREEFKNLILKCKAKGW